MKILFFGSTENSVCILNALHNNTALQQYNIFISAVVTQPPRPIGRKQIITNTPTHIWAEQHHIPVHYFENNPLKKTTYKNEREVTLKLKTYDYQLVISASYGQLIPWEIIEKAQYKGINIHPSLLPRFRGADPTPWTILSGDKETGVTIVGLTKQFDEGKIFAQQRIAVPENTFHEDLRQKLFEQGATLLEKTLPSILDGTNTGIPQDKWQATYARRLIREDGFIPWSVLEKAMNGELIKPEELPPLFHNPTIQQSNNPIIQLIHRSLYALSPWPGIWTLVTINQVQKRLKLLSLHIDKLSGALVLNTVQLEGKTPQPYDQIQKQLHS